MLETHRKLFGTKLDFFRKKKCPKNEENVPKIEFFEFIEKFGHQKLINLVHIESL